MHIRQWLEEQRRVPLCRRLWYLVAICLLGYIKITARASRASPGGSPVALPTPEVSDTRLRNCWLCGLTNSCVFASRCHTIQIVRNKEACMTVCTSLTLCGAQQTLCGCRST